MRASIDSHIFETGTPISAAGCCTRLTQIRDSTSSAMFVLVLPHLSRYIVLHSQLIGKAISVCNEDKTTNSAECFCSFLLKDSWNIFCTMGIRAEPPTRATS